MLNQLEIFVNLRLISVVYVNEIDQQLSHIFSNFNDLKIVRFSATYLDTHIIDGDRILTLINQSLPKKLNIIIFEDQVTFSDNLLENLMVNWKGPRPINIGLHAYADDTHNLLKKYEGLGFLEYQYI